MQNAIIITETNLTENRLLKFIKPYAIPIIQEDCLLIAQDDLLGIREEWEYGNIESVELSIHQSISFIWQHGIEPGKSILADTAKEYLITCDPIHITELIINDKKICFHRPYKVTPIMDGDFLVASDPSISLYVYATNRDKLINEVEEQLIMTWKSYIWRDESRLSVDARDVKNRLKELAFEVEYTPVFMDKWKSFYSKMIRPALERMS